MSIRDYPGLKTGVTARLPGDAKPQAEEVGKCRAPTVIELALLPTGVVCEYRFHPTRRWRFDYAWVIEKLALEVEGGIWTKGRHIRSLGFKADMEKYREAVLLGWRVLRCTPDELNSGKARTIVERAITRSKVR